MRVALVCPYDLSAPGGVQSQALGIATGLARRGHAVAIVAPMSSEAFAALDPSVRLYRLGKVLAVPANGSRAPIALSPAAGWRTLRALRAFSPDVVHVHEPLVPGACLAALTFASGPVLGTFHRFGAGAAYRALGVAARPLIGRLAGASAVSHAAASTARAVLGDRLSVEVVPNGVDVARFSSTDASDTDEPLVVFVGRHEERKGLSVLLAAFADLEVPARLEIVGKGPQTATLRARYGGDRRIGFLGRLGADEVATCLGRAAVLVAPALGGESFGIVVIEALAAGAAVIASDLPGYREAAGPCAVFVPPGSVAALRDALRAMLRDPARRAALVAAGRTRVAGLDFSEIARAYEGRYAALTASDAPAEGFEPGGASPYTA